MENQLTLFKVRDLRKKDQYKVDDIYLNGYARVCKPVATAVYNSLCRHSEFNSQKAFPSQFLMAYQHDISIKSVRRAIKKLAEYNIILIGKERRNGKFMNYIYTLLDKSEWKDITTGQKRPMVQPSDKSAIRRKRPTKDNKVINKDNKEKTVAPEIATIYPPLIEKLTKSNQRHIRVIGIWVKERKIDLQNEAVLKSIIKRNLRPAVLLAGYQDKDIIETIKMLENVDYLKGHFTLETCYKFIDDTVREKKKKGPDIIRWEKIDRDGKITMKPIYEISKRTT